jgi:hypothetical protein
MDYAPRDIEQKWQSWWKANRTYQVSNHSSKPKYYILDMFPYPSGRGCTSGTRWATSPATSWPATNASKALTCCTRWATILFGLPAEQYAIQTGIHPAVATDQNIDRYREQLENIGFSFDWSREVRTSDPAFYRWTQWIFMQLFNTITTWSRTRLCHKRFGAACLPPKAMPAYRPCATKTPRHLRCRLERHERARTAVVPALKYRLTFPEEATSTGARRWERCCPTTKSKTA